MILIDTHTHLYSDEFDSDRDAMVERALKQGVKKFLLPNIDLGSVDSLHQFCDRYPEQSYPMMGLHPTSVKEDYKHVLRETKELLNHRKYIAIGEIGIDLYWDKTFAKEQRMALLEQFQWAIDYNLPVVIHSRESFEIIMAIINEFNNPQLRGVFHCFTGTENEAQQIIDKGFMLGIGGVLTFKNSGLANEIKNIDIKHLILETDSPYLTPTPYRGKRNESAYISIIAQKLAATQSISLEEVAAITTKNAINLFQL